MWAAGVVMWEIMTFGAMPYAQLSNARTVFEVTRFVSKFSSDIQGDFFLPFVDGGADTMLTCR